MSTVNLIASQSLSSCDKHLKPPPYLSKILLHCVPLPEPGPPMIKTVRGFSDASLSSFTAAGTADDGAAAFTLEAGAVAWSNARAGVSVPIAGAVASTCGRDPSAYN